MLSEKTKAATTTRSDIEEMKISVRNAIDMHVMLARVFRLCYAMLTEEQKIRFLEMLANSGVLDQMEDVLKNGEPKTAA